VIAVLLVVVGPVGRSVDEYQSIDDKQFPFHTALEVLQIVRKFDLMNLAASLSFVRQKLKFPVRFEVN
jgi:hypothetical protein